METYIHDNHTYKYTSYSSNSKKKKGVSKFIYVDENDSQTKGMQQIQVPIH